MEIITIDINSDYSWAYIYTWFTVQKGNIFGYLVYPDILYKNMTNEQNWIKN